MSSTKSPFSLHPHPVDLRPKYSSSDCPSRSMHMSVASTCLSDETIYDVARAPSREIAHSITAGLCLRFAVVDITPSFLAATFRTYVPHQNHVSAH